MKKQSKPKVAFFDFPQYEKTLAGKLVGRYLKGEFGDPLLLSPYIASLPYALDRIAARDELNKALEKGVVICNRYIPSNIGHQASKLPEDKRDEFISWLEQMEYGELKLPKPTLVIYLYVPVEISSHLVEKKEARAYIGGESAKGAKDGHEKDMEYQQKVIDEIKVLYHDYGIREIHIEDDNFTFNHDLVRELCGKLKENNLNITWTCPNGVRLDTLTEDLLLTMKEAGLYFISVGIESGSDKILRDMKKNLTTAKIREKIELIKRCGLGVSGFFIIGYPTETKEDMMDTINFAISLDLKRALFSLFKPFPGVEITNELIRRGEWKNVSDEEWARFVLADAVYAPPGFTLKEMKKLRLMALLRFYFRPKIVVGFLLDIKGFNHWLVVLKRMYSWLYKVK